MQEPLSYRTVRRHYHPTFTHFVAEWFWFRYAPLPNRFSMNMLVYGGLLFGFPIILGAFSWDTMALSLVALFFIDFFTFLNFCNARYALATKLYREGKDWKNIHPWDVDELTY